MKAFIRIVKKYGHWLFLSLMILVTVYMNIYVAGHIMDGDASDLLRRGWTVARDKNLFTQDLYFTTEPRLFDLPAVFSAFFHLSDDWSLVRFLGTMAMQAYYAAGLLYLLRQTGVKQNSAVYATGMLLVPFSTTYARIVLYHAHYLLYIAHALWIMGLTLRLLHTSDHRSAILPGIVLALLWILVATNGIRHMMVVGIPMLAFAALKLCRTLSAYRWEEGSMTGPGQLIREPSVRLTLILAASCCCFLAGYAIYAGIIVPGLNMYNAGTSIFRPVSGPERYSNIFNGWLVAIGFRNSGMTLVGVRGLGLLAALVAFGYFLYASFRTLIEDASLAKQLTGGMLAVSLVTTTLIFVFEYFDRTFELYYIPVASMAVLVMAHEFDRFQEKAASIGRRLMILLACGCFLFQGVYTLFFMRFDRVALDMWSGIGYMEINTVDQVQDCVDFMQEEGHTHAMIGYWYANPMIEMSDGELSVIGLEDNYQFTQSLSMYCWGAPKSPFAPENLPDTVIVFVKKERAEVFESTFPEAALVHQGSVFNGYEANAGLIRQPEQ